MRTQECVHACGRCLWCAGGRLAHACGSRSSSTRGHHKQQCMQQCVEQQAVCVRGARTHDEHPQLLGSSVQARASQEPAGGHNHGHLQRRAAAAALQQGWRGEGKRGAQAEAAAGSVAAWVGGCGCRMACAGSCCAETKRAEWQPVNRGCRCLPFLPPRPHPLPHHAAKWRVMCRREQQEDLPVHSATTTAAPTPTTHLAAKVAGDVTGKEGGEETGQEEGGGEHLQLLVVVGAAGGTKGSTGWGRQYGRGQSIVKREDVNNLQLLVIVGAAGRQAVWGTKGEGAECKRGHSRCCRGARARGLHAGA